MKMIQLRRILSESDIGRRIAGRQPIGSADCILGAPRVARYN
jgi:hypothetical protein